MERLTGKPSMTPTGDNPGLTAEADIVVVGGGMAGLAAGGRAAECGATPLILEKGPRLGGSMRLSAGLIWTYESFRAARKDVPRGDPQLQRVIIDGLDQALGWLETLDIEVLEPPVELPTGDTVTAPTPGANCGKIDPEEYIEYMRGLIEESGGRILTETPMVGLRQEEGRVRAVDAERSGEAFRASAEDIILATGGFQGSMEHLQQFVTDSVANLWLRSNPWSTGDGLSAAQALGATTTGGLGTFYGHNLAAPPAQVTPERYLELTQYYGPFAIALDRDGLRFTDESESDLEHTLAQDTLRKADGQAYYVIDQELYDDEVFSMGHIGTIVERTAEAGGQVLRGDSLDGLKDAFDGAGVNGKRAVATIRSYNEAVREDEAARLDPPRRDHARRIDTPPYYAIAVQPGITFTMGGLAVDQRMRVLRRATNRSRLPGTSDGESIRCRSIPGLYAAGADIGGVNNRGYMGGLSTALVTGRLAGEQAALG